MALNLTLSIFIGYLLGSIPFTQLMARWRRGIDLRTVGSKNVGGMNAMRNVGWGWGFLAGLGDFFKGIVALVIAQSLLGGAAWRFGPLYYFAGLAAIVGHNYPVWLKFRGGKGVGTALGLALWVMPLGAVIGIVVGVALLVWTKNVTLATAVAYLLMLGLSRYLPSQPGAAFVLLASLALMSLGILPEAIRLARTPGGLRDYFRDPIKVYRKPAKSDE